MIFKGLNDTLLMNNRRSLLSFLSPSVPNPPATPVPPPSAAPASLASPAIAATAAAQRSKAAAAASMGGASGSDVFAPPATAKSALLGAS